MRRPAAALLAGLLGAVLVGPAAGGLPGGPSTAATANPLACGQPPVTGPCPDWVRLYASPTGGDQPDRAFETAMSADGQRTFVSGATWDDASGADDITTLAVNTASGEVMWAASHGGDRADQPTAIALSPDGSTLFVAGVQDSAVLDGESHGKYVTIAYDVTSGDQLWTATYGADVDGADSARWSSAAAVAANPDGSVVYVTGSSGATTLTTDVVTLALDARTGEERWRTRFSGPSEEPPTEFSVVDLDGGSGISVSPDGARVVVSGYTYTGSNRSSYLVLTYDTTTQDPGGELLWSAVEDWDGSTQNLGRFVTSSPDGATVYVVGEQGAAQQPRAGVLCCSQTSAFGIVSYDAATGTRLWRSAHRGQHGGITAPNAVAIDPAGERLYVVGRANGPEFLLAEGQTVAFDAVSGEVAWDAAHAIPAAYFTSWADVGVSDDGTRVVVTGHGLGPYTSQIGTVAYDASTGSSVWQATYAGDPATEPTYFATSLEVTPDGRGVVVAGGVSRPNDPDNRGDYAILRYTTPGAPLRRLKWAGDAPYAEPGPLPRSRASAPRTASTAPTHASPAHSHGHPRTKA